MLVIWWVPFPSTVGNRLDFHQARSPHEPGVETTQVLPPTQPMSEVGTEGSQVYITQPSALAGISHGVETQVLRNMFNSLPPSSQIIESEMLGPSPSRVSTQNVLILFQTLTLKGRARSAKSRMNHSPQASRRRENLQLLIADWTAAVKLMYASSHTLHSV